MAKVSILIPVYNTQDFIAESIESILNQTYRDFELVIVDDCSTDNTYSICQRYASSDSRIKLFRNEKNLGMMRNWNYGISLCKGDYWGKLDADDWWNPEMIEVCVKIFVQYPGVGMVCTRHVNIDEKGRIIEESVSNPPDFARNQAFSFVPLVKSGVARMFSYDVARQGIGLMRMEFFRKYGNYLMIQPADTEMYFRIGAHYRVYCIDKVLHRHRIWDASDTRSTIIKDFGRLERNLFEVRMAIFKYYLQESKIRIQEYKRLMSDNTHVYQIHLIYKYRTEGKYLHSLLLLLKLFITYPLKSTKFYYSRVLAFLELEKPRVTKSTINRKDC